MPPSLQSIVDQVEHILQTAKCDKYSETDRMGLLQYRRLDLNERIPFSTSSALKSHLLATKSPKTPLPEPVRVFCPDNLKNTLLDENLDLRISIRLKLGYSIDTYEDLVRWYISFS